MQLSGSGSLWENQKKKNYLNYILCLLELHPVLAGTLQQDMDYSLNLFGRSRKASNVTFYLGEKYYLFGEN